MRSHNAWHLAMFDAEQGDIMSALEILDTWLLPPNAISPIEACDATALLWRLGYDGAKFGSRWRKVSEVFEHGATPGFWPFVDLHAALAHVCAGETVRAQRLQQLIATIASGNNFAAQRARRVTLPATRALLAWAEGRYGEAASTLAGLRSILGEIGGSRVQLEVFNSIEKVSAQRQYRRLENSMIHVTQTTPAVLKAA
jgi:hypothetical protein